MHREDRQHDGDEDRWDPRDRALEHEDEDECASPDRQRRGHRLTVRHTVNEAP